MDYIKAFIVGGIICALAQILMDKTENGTATVTITGEKLSYSREGRISPVTAAHSMTPAAKARTISLNRWDIFLKIKPKSEPKTVAPPTPMAVSKTIFIHINSYMLII